MMYQTNTFQKLAFFGAIICCMLLTLVSCKSEQKQMSSNLHKVIVLKVNPRSINHIAEVSGRISAFQTAEVRPQVSGILQRRLFLEGSIVKEGQSLYKIDPATYSAEVRSAEAALAKANAALNQAKLRRDRRRSLLGSHAVSMQAVEDADAAFLQAKAEVEVANANLLTAQIKLRYTDVLAPISGRIGKSQVTQGSLVTANQEEPLAIIHQVDHVYVDMTRQSDEIFKLQSRYKSGQLKRQDQSSAEVTLLIGDNYKYPIKGKLQFTDISVDESTGMVLMRAIFANKDQTLLPGLYVRAIIDEGVEENALCVPERAVQRDARGQASVFVVDQNNTAEVKFVDIQKNIGKDIIVSKGLKAGDLVIIDGLRRLKAGDKVVITNAI